MMLINKYENLGISRIIRIRKEFLRLEIMERLPPWKDYMLSVVAGPQSLGYGENTLSFRRLHRRQAVMRI